MHTSVSVSRFDIVNMIETKSLCASSSDFADMLSMTRGFALLILKVKVIGKCWAVWGCDALWLPLLKLRVFQI